MHHTPIVIVRPGVIYGPGGDEISRRVGLWLLGYLLNIGNNNILPLSYVDNCVDAIILAGTIPGIEGQAFNVHDSELCTCNQFLRQYLKQGNKIKNIKVPYSLFYLFAWFIDNYARYSKGQIPPFVNTYKVSSIWKPLSFDNTKITEILGWTQKISTKDGVKRHFEYCKQNHSRKEM